MDVRLAVRLLRKAPVFSAIAILTLALGVGATTAVFSQIDAVFWKPLPIPRPHELRHLLWSSRKPSFVYGPNVIVGPRLPIGETYGSFSYIAYRSMRDQATGFANLACWADLGEARPVVLRNRGFGDVQFVSGNYFETVGVGVVLGRTLRTDDDTRGGRAAVVSYSFWQRAFGGDPSVLHETVNLNGQDFAIVGVTPAGFFGLDPSTTPDVMIPIGAIEIAAATRNPAENPVLWSMCRVVGRIHAGVSEEAARLDAERWLRDAIAAHPPPSEYEMPRLWLADGGYGLDTVREAMGTPLAILMTVVVGILLIACANVAGLLVVRSAARRREIATRLALGASRGRIVRQLLTESLILSLAGGLCGIALAYALDRLSPALMGGFMPMLFGSSRHLAVAITPDSRVLLFSILATLVTGSVFGCIPALHATGFDLTSSIKHGSQGGGRGSRFSFDRPIVALQAALSLVVVVGAGLFQQTIANLRSTPLGYEPAALLTVKIEPRTGGIPQERRADFFEQALHLLERLPGIVSVSATTAPPFQRQASIFSGGLTSTVCFPGDAARELTDPQATVALSVIAPRYFETLRARMIAGSEFDWRNRQDRPDSPYVVIVNESFVRTFLPGRSPLDQRLGFECPAKPAEFRIAGVVADIKNGPRQKVVRWAYFPPNGSSEVMTIVVRASGRPEQLIPTIRRSMSDFNRAVPTFGEVTVAEARRRDMRQEELLRTLLIAFSGVALLLTSIGIYGMLAYMVAGRTSEIGLRMALGAQPAAVVRIILGESLLTVGAGLLAGISAAVAMTRSIQAMLFGVSAHDPRTIAASALLFVLVAAVAAIVPAWRATRIDPLPALRSDP